MRRRTLWLAFGAFIILLLTAGTLYAAHNMQDDNSLAPRQLVEMYYRSIANGDFATARSCLAPSLLCQATLAADSDFNNLALLSNLQVSNAAQIQLDNKYIDEVQVVAQYDAVYKKVITSNNGRQVRFVYVGKRAGGEPWKIISIGTGP